MKRVLWLGIGLLLGACAKSPDLKSGNEFVQETHGGDLAVAKVLAIFTDYDPFASHPAIFSRRGASSPALFKTGRDGIVINRDAILRIEYTALRSAFFGRLFWEEFVSPPPRRTRGVRNPILTHTRMTPLLFKAWSAELFHSLEKCAQAAPDQPASLPLSLWLALKDSTEVLAPIPVEIAKGAIVDVVTKQPVDIGVTIDDPPRFLLSSSAELEWNPSEERQATDYLVFHENAHILLRRHGRYDGDYQAASALFSYCRPYLSENSL